jgi:hypothetical protein
MSVFEYVSASVAIVMSLSVARVMSGIGAFILAKNRVPSDWLVDVGLEFCRRPGCGRKLRVDTRGQLIPSDASRGVSQDSANPGTGSLLADDVGGPVGPLKVSSHRKPPLRVPTGTEETDPYAASGRRRLQSVTNRDAWFW